MAFLGGRSGAWRAGPRLCHHGRPPCMNEHKHHARPETRCSPFEERRLRVAVVTPYCDEPEETLRRCHESVLAQTHPCAHVLVADGDGAPFVKGWRAQHIVLGQRHSDLGDTPRAAGSLSAIGQGFDAIAYLDADNWYEPDHVATMIDLHRTTGAAVCVARRTLRRLDGSLLSATGDPGEGVDFVDTNCLFLMAEALRVAPMWALIPREAHAIGDRVVWGAILALKLRAARSDRPTVCYRTSFRAHYVERGEAPPPGAKDNQHVRAALAWWSGRSPEELSQIRRRLGLSR